MTSTLDELDDQRVARLGKALADAPFEAWLASTLANVRYATGHQNGAVALGELSSCVAVVTAGDSLLCAPMSDHAAALGDAGRLARGFRGYGSFHFAAAGGPAPVAAGADLVAVLVASLVELGLERATVGYDDGLDASVRAALEAALPELVLVPDEGWGLRVRSRKTPAEVELLTRAARLAEDGIHRAIDAARPGVTERELMAVVGRTMLEGGGLPQFLVVTTGPRSAYSDAFATDRPLAPGDLVRFDVGCTVEGYWSDIGRTAVVGEPDRLQRERYAAILAGEQEQLDRIRAGVSAAEMFRCAVDKVEAEGLSPYRRHHCGHGIGLEVYEPPIITAAEGRLLEPGMTFCLETPFYELGWGGMMVEDTVVVTEEGHVSLTTSDRGLRVISA